MRTVASFATTLALLIGSSSGTWAQGSANASNPPPSTLGGAVRTTLTLALITAILVVVVALAQHAITRRKRIEEAALLQSQLFDALSRDTRFTGLRLVPRTRVSGWLGSQLTVEIAGDVPTPDLRETVMRTVSAEAWRLRPDVITVDHLFIVPAMH